MQTAWGWLPAIYLFLGGMAAGSLLVAAAFEFYGKRYQYDFCPTALVGATVPGPLITLGTLLLVLDLGAGLREPWRIFYMFTHPTSVMTWGVWLLTLFIPVSLAYGFLESVDSFPQAREWLKQRRWLRWTAFLWNLPLRRTKRVFAGVGSVLAVGVAIYTGILLSAVGPAIPFWATPVLSFLHIPMMPVLFLVSALSTGLGLTVDLTATLAIGPMEQRVKSLPWIHMALIGVETLMLGLLLLTALVEGGPTAQSARDILVGSHSIVFWVLIVIPGFIFPFVIHAYAAGLGRHSLVSGVGSGIGIVMAGLFLRYLILISGIPAAL
ncbi:MAG: NrfD/PsrC family molybdoenzyme membrane anchor subunit [Anaerolineae bacterium]